MVPALLLLVVACRPGDASTSPSSLPVATADTAPPMPTSTPTGGTADSAPTATGDSGPSPLTLFVERARDDLHLAWRGTVSPPQEGPLTVRLVGDDGTDRSWADDSDIALLGLHAETTYTLSVEVEGQTVTGAFTTLPLPSPFPTFEVLAHEPERIAPGHTLVPVSHPDHGLLIVLDEDLQPVWVSVSDQPWYAAELVGDRILGIRGNDARWVDWLGARGRVDSDRKLHHDAVPLGDGVLALGQGPVEVPSYCTSYDTPDELAPATLLDQHLVTYDAKGQEIDELALSSVLPTTRCAWDGRTVDDGGFDWLHLNSLAPTSDGRFVLSSRTQSAVITVDLAGELSWILSNPVGWPAEVADRLLTPIGDLTWPEDQHAPHYDPVTGDLWLFDNGGRRHTPYEPEPAESGQYSRLVHYRIDEGARTVEQVWDWQPDPAVFAAIMGDADPLPDGHVLSVFTWLKEHDGVSNGDRGWGEKASRVIEVDPATGEAVLDLLVVSDAAELPAGWWTYRVQRVPELVGAPRSPR